MNMKSLITRDEGSGIKNYPAMFDLLKGFGMLAIVYLHTRNMFSVNVIMEGGNQLAKGAVLNLSNIFFMLNAMMPIFFVMSGYFFKPTDMRKSIKTQAHYLLIPLVWTVAFSFLGCFAMQSMLEHSIRAGLKNAIGIPIGFLTGINAFVTLFGINFYGFCTLWYLISLFIGWNLLNYIFLKFDSEKKRLLAVIVLSLFASFLSIFISGWYGITAGCLSTLFLYLGYWLKKEKILKQKLKTYFIVITLALFVIEQLYSDVLMSTAWFKWSVFDIAILAMAAILFLHLFARLNQLNWKIFDFLRFLGHYSLWFMCVHSFEFYALPLYYLVGRYIHHLMVDFYVVCIVRLFIDVALLLVVIQFNKLITSLKQKKAEQRQNLVSNTDVAVNN